MGQYFRGSEMGQDYPDVSLFLWTSLFYMQDFGSNINVCDFTSQIQNCAKFKFKSKLVEIGGGDGKYQEAPIRVCVRPIWPIRIECTRLQLNCESSGCCLA